MRTSGSEEVMPRIARVKDSLLASVIVLPNCIRKNKKAIQSLRGGFHLFGASQKRNQNGDEEDCPDKAERQPDRDVPPRLREHLQADKDEDQCEADAEITEIAEQIREQKIECAQTENSENVGTEDDEGILRNSEDSGNGVDGEGDVGDFDDEKDEEKRCGEELAILTLEEMRAAILLGDAKMSTGETEKGIALEVRSLVALPKHMDSAVDQEQTEDGENPVEARDQESAGGDHEAASNEGAEYAPGKDAMLDAVFDLKGAENDEEDEEIVDAKRFFDDVAGEIFHAALRTEPVPDKKAETKSETDPQGAEEYRFADCDLVSFAMEDTQVEGQRKQNK